MDGTTTRTDMGEIVKEGRQPDHQCYNEYYQLKSSSLLNGTVMKCSCGKFWTYDIKSNESALAYWYETDEHGCWKGKRIKVGGFLWWSKYVEERICEVNGKRTLL